MNLEKTIEKALATMARRKKVTEKGKEELEKLFEILEKVFPDNATVLSKKSVSIRWQHWDGETTYYRSTFHPDSLGVYVGAVIGQVGLWEKREYNHRYVAPYELTYVNWDKMVEAIEDFLTIMATYPTGEEQVKKIETIREILEKLSK